VDDITEKILRLSCVLNIILCKLNDCTIARMERGACYQFEFHHRQFWIPGIKTLLINWIHIGSEGERGRGLVLLLL